MRSATVGQFLVNETLPEELRDYERVLDKRGLNDLLREVAQKHPDRYKDISFALNEVGREGAQESGSFSFGLRHLKTSKAAGKTRKRIQDRLTKILSRADLDDTKMNEAIIRAVGSEMKPQQEAIMEESLADNNPLAMQVLAGARGNPMNLASLLGSDLLYADHRDEPLPIPVLRSYSEGLSPEEYWAGTYGARKGIIATKFATQDAGFLSKQLNQVAHRLVVTDNDYEDEGQQKIRRGVPVDTDDSDNEGALLAADTGPYKRNTVITPKIRKHLRRLGKKRILVRSPMVGGSPAGGVYARDVGVREKGTLPGRGEQVGLQAAQALSEPLSQAQLAAKHSGGVAGEEEAVGGFKYINQLIQVPKKFKGGAAHTTMDGTVQRIEEAPAGGYFVTVDDVPHYVGVGYDLKVKKGDKVEAGDIISEGFPNPSIVTKYKGVGEGRRYFVSAYRDAMKGAGLSPHRRNIELLSRGLINHVRLTEEYEDNVPDDVIPYSTLEHKWKPRSGARSVTPKQAVGKYLERPVLHYTIGTKVRPSMLVDLKEFEIDNIDVHDDPPPFEPEMIRGMYSLQHDPDWMTRMYGSGLKKSLLEGTRRGAVSEERGTSFVPSVSRSVDFGRIPGGLVKSPEAGQDATF
jgi:DNA-directed RNA polymerase subunit beta'